MNGDDVLAGKPWMSQEARIEFEMERTRHMNITQHLDDPRGTENMAFRRLLNDMHTAVDRFEETQQSATDADTAKCSANAGGNA